MSLVNLSGVQAAGRRMVPAGNYLVRCMESMVKNTKTGSGQYLECKFAVESPSEFGGIIIWHNFNIQNTNPKAQEIGLGQLKGFLIAAGKSGESLENASDLCGLQAEAKVTIKKDDVWGDSNNISYFKAVKKEEPIDESALM